VIYYYGYTKHALLGGLMILRSNDLATVIFALGQSENGASLFNNDQTGRVISPILFVVSKIFSL
jgi:hypothetical protein